MAEKERLIKTFKCTNCGSNRRVVREVADEEVAKGKFGEDLPVGSHQNLIAIFDPRKPCISCPVLMVIRDICAECGTEYVCEVRRTIGQPQAMMPPGALGDGRPKHFPFSTG